MTAHYQRTLPSFLRGYGDIKAYSRACEAGGSASLVGNTKYIWKSGQSKILPSLDDALAACEIKNGAVLSFHHHLRNGDSVLNLVLDAAARKGIKNLTIAASSIFPVHAPLVEHMRSGVVSRLYTAYMSGPVASAISGGLLETPVVMQTHGGRARAIESGELHIDIAFIASPAADLYGNISGSLGPAACGPLGYAMVDAQHADRVVAVTDHLVAYPACPIDIKQDRVDFVVVVDSIGDPAGILSGTTRPTQDPTGLQIASTAASVIEASGLLGSDFSFQTGAGGISLAVADALAKVMRRHSIQGSFAAGGVTGYLCDMLESGLFRNIFDVQCFDLKAVESYRQDHRHMAMSASLYANPHGKGAVVDRLDAMILGAAEVDLDFNVNVTTGSTGRILGGSGGHADTADGSKLAIVTTQLCSSFGAKVVDRVQCITTPGNTIDVVVTEAGVAVNPLRQDLTLRLKEFGIPVRSIEELREIAKRQSPSVQSQNESDQIVAVVEYRDGSVIDLVRSAT